MPGTLVVVGYGPGVSAAVAEKFGSEGFSLALIARRPGSFERAVESYRSRGMKASGFVADAADPASMREALAHAREELGSIHVLQWNAIGGTASGDLLGSGAEGPRAVFDIAVFGLLDAVQAVLPDLEAAADGAVLVTNGAYGDDSAAMNAFAVRSKAMGVALANAAKHKLVGLLAERLRDKNVFVADVVVAGAVRGTPSDTGGPTIEGARIAAAFWTLFKARTATSVRVA